MVYGGTITQYMAGKQGRAEDFKIGVAITLLNIFLSASPKFLSATPNFLLFGVALRSGCGARPILVLR